MANPQVRPLAPFGAEVAGIQIAAASPGAADMVRQAVAMHGVAVLRRQAAGDADLVGFLSRLGEIMFTAGETPVAGAPELNLVSNIGRTTPPVSVFHSDTSYVARPPAFSALRAVQLPRAGGGTLFSDQVRAARDLPPGVTDWLRGRTLRHDAAGSNGAMQAIRHPVLRRHPDTGETALYLSSLPRCTALSGVDERLSARIVALLYRRSIRRSGLYRHDWQAGDIVLWDNRRTMHRADHGGVIGDRVLHRGLVLGEAPQAA